jgi:cobalt/nickel transport system permease protein
MHIPDGYLSPIVSIGLGAATVPAWGIASQKVKAILNNRTIPLLAIFAALSFTIMMFNIPVPGGTTAHGVGGTLIAIVLGPWAAVIAISVALVIQALFFGDGGVLAIFANSLNMGVLLPFVGYAVYRLLAGRAPLLSSRRAVAAGIAAYVGITVSALAVGIELGIQPLLFSDASGRPLYSPYDLNAAVPAMLLAHVLGASIVEGLITFLGVAYLQKSHPNYLTSLRGVYAPGVTETGTAPARPYWQILVGAGIAAAVVLFAVGLVLGGGDPGRLFGADWSRVNWADVGTMLLVSAVIAVVIVPLAYLALPRRLKRIGAAFTVVAVIAPLGLIAPGFAYGEGGSKDVQAAFGYIPQGLQHLSGIFSAPLSGYTIPLPFFGGANAALWHAAVGYQAAGIVGILLCGGVILAIAPFLRGRGAAPDLHDAPDVPDNADLASRDGTRGRGRGRRGATSAASAPPDQPRVAASPPSQGDRRRDGRVGWLEQTLGGITASIEHAIFTEQHARTDGWLQRRDPRAKLGMFLALVLAASLTASLAVLVGLYALTLGAARASRVPFSFFVKRVWLGIPFFAGIVVIPAIFMVPGPRLFDLAIGPLHLAPSAPGAAGAVLFVARVGVSVSLAVLLVMTTPWADILKSLRSLRVPQVFVLVLSMTYRYIFLFLHTANGILLARKSRVVARTTGGEQRRWISGTMGNLMSRAFKMSNDVYAAMLARGFSGEMRARAFRRMRTADWAALGGVAAVAALAVLGGRTLP